ncbi:MAG: murein transglycosylase [Azospirillum sp.]|nr:murein transglycosylase [Azospirillum sp.]
MTAHRRTVGSALFLAVLAACTPEAPTPLQDQLSLTAQSFDGLAGWREDELLDAVPAFAASCRKLANLPGDRSLGPDGAAGRAGDWHAACRALLEHPPSSQAAARGFFEQWFTPYAAGNNGVRQGLFTGYYEIELRGSRSADGRYSVPLYRRPPDLITADLGEFNDRFKGERITGRVVSGHLKPYDDRSRITAGALSGRGLELLWVDDPIDAFFLEIQGSGRVALPDGAVVRVGYDGQNGRPYFPIGRELIARGALERDKVSLQTIRAWLRAHPDEAGVVMNKNPSYVFFRDLQGAGPVGAQGLTLTPGRSLAVDHRFVPYGTPVWLDAEDPLVPGQRLRRLLIAQDTGGAIRGPVRGDVFWGHGADAEARAGVMKSTGEYWLLLPKTVAR